MWLRETRAIQWVQMQWNAMSDCPEPEVHCHEKNDTQHSAHNIHTDN